MPFGRLQLALGRYNDSILHEAKWRYGIAKNREWLKRSVKNPLRHRAHRAHCEKLCDILEDIRDIIESYIPD
jgi:hypothetical protein